MASRYVIKTINQDEFFQRTLIKICLTIPNLALYSHDLESDEMILVLGLCIVVPRYCYIHFQWLLCK